MSFILTFFLSVTMDMSPYIHTRRDLYTLPKHECMVSKIHACKSAWVNFRHMEFHMNLDMAKLEIAYNLGVTTDFHVRTCWAKYRQLRIFLYVQRVGHIAKAPN
jgi:hypothetical protein